MSVISKYLWWNSTISPALLRRIPITELVGLQDLRSSVPPSWLEQAARDCNQVGFEQLHRWRLYNLAVTGQPVLVFDDNSFCC